MIYDPISSSASTILRTPPSSRRGCEMDLNPPHVRHRSSRTDSAVIISRDALAVSAKAQDSRRALGSNALDDVPPPSAGAGAAARNERAAGRFIHPDLLTIVVLQHEHRDPSGSM